ncbi:MAG: hypothetical protein QHI48_11190 [Bacteroidota bacterium]|nr:hypothetical protein [Bacteroidota bacterium]
MVTALGCFFSFAVLVLSPPTLSAPDTFETLSPHRTDALRANIERNFADRSPDIRAGTIQLVMELRDVHPALDMEYVIIPLLSVLKNDKSPELRILAACALLRFDSERARFAVSRRALYDPDERVARRCAVLSRCWKDARKPPCPEGLGSSSSSRRSVDGR